MNVDLYHELCDDAQELIGMASRKMTKAKDILFSSGDPGIRFSNRRAAAVVQKLDTARHEIDELPALENE